MKKILLTLLTILLLGTTLPKTYAQEETVENQETAVEQTTEEKEETLADTLETTQEEITEKQPLSFGTILIATLTPALFIIICYMLIKFFKQ